MKFGVISGEQARIYGIPQKNNLTIIINAHGSSRFDNGHQVSYTVPSNVRIFFYAVPGQSSYISPSFIIDICNQKDIFSEVVLIYEPGDEMPDLELSVDQQVSNVLGKTDPYYGICKSGGVATFFNMFYKGNTTSQKKLNTLSDGDINLSELVDKIVVKKKFNDIHVIACSNYPNSQSKPGLFQLPSEMATLGINWVANVARRIGPANKPGHLPIESRQYQYNYDSPGPDSSVYMAPFGTPSIPSSGTTSNPGNFKESGFKDFKEPGFKDFKGPGFSGYTPSGEFDTDQFFAFGKINVKSILKDIIYLLK